MNETATCALCDGPIDVGEAWMEADEEGARLLAHAGCVYRDEREPEARGRWTPGEGAVSPERRGS